jgi:hypothetical protein
MLLRVLFDKVFLQKRGRSDTKGINAFHPEAMVGRQVLRPIQQQQMR